MLNPSVIKWNEQYFNYYSGYNGTSWQTGLAISEDGYHWQKYDNNPVFCIEDIKEQHTDYIAANGSAVVYENKIYYFYQYSNKENHSEIGLAISEDGYHFEDMGNVLSIGEAGSWESSGCADPYAIVENNTIYLYYLGMNDAKVQRLGVAMSTDGLTWTRSIANPILDIGAAGAFDENGLGEPSVYYSSPYYYMIYTGRNMAEERNIGLAVSTNGIDWFKWSYNGAFKQTENWNSAVICDTTFIKVEDKVLVYYGGGNQPEPAQNLNGQIGVFEVDLSQNRDMLNWNVNANWSESLVTSEDILQGSYPIDGGTCWCSGNTSIELINDTSKSDLFISGWIPVDTIHSMKDVSDVNISVYVNDELKIEKSFSTDEMFEFEISKDTENEILSIRIEADSEVVPSEYSDSLDERTLSYTLNCIEQR